MSLLNSTSLGECQLGTRPVYVYGDHRRDRRAISSGGTVLYLHHDQQGSTRLLTSSTGAKEASFTYDAYGNQTGHTGTATTPLGYAGQYTSSDTGLIYLRARVYDPATAQFLSVDPLAAITRAPYNYAEDNPITLGDPSGLWTPTESIERFSNEIGEGISNVAGGFVNGLTGGLIGGGGNSCSTGYQIGEYGSLLGALIPGEGEAEFGRILDSAAGHIFRDAEGHLAEDTPENRALIESVVKPENYVRTGGEGDVLYRETLSNGTQAWAKVFNGAITNGGLNQVPFP